MTDPRFFPPRTTSPLKPDYLTELLSSLERINIFNPPVQTCSTGWRFAGLYRGPTSIAYLFFRLSHLCPALEFKQQSMLEWAEAYLTLSTHVQPQAVTPDYCGVINETLANLALRCAMTGDHSLIRHLCSFEALVNDPDNDGSNEWLYGRAGYVYLLRMVRSLSPSSSAKSRALLDAVIEKTIDRILRVPRPWLWHSKHYIGACHGTMGIITQISQSNSTYAPQLTPIIQELLAQQLPSGNFPSSLSHDRDLNTYTNEDQAHDDRLVQFCHGATGFVISLQILLSLLPESPLTDEIRAAVARAKECIRQRGLLTKPPSLCHGIAGNALVFADNRDRSIFDSFLSEMTSAKLEANGRWMAKAGHSDDWAGLYGGEAGRAWIWAVAATPGQGSVMIGYNDV